MHEPTPFGPYLLLEKLNEGPLGEAYRAGRIEGTAIGELVFLRTFSGPGTQTGELVETLRAFSSSDRRIQGPGLTYPVETGEVGGVVYSAYPYTTGWDVLELIETASSGFSELERDHGLLVAERVAKGLAVVHQTDPAAGTPFHGFLVPQNVRLTSEGEINLIGFEAGPFLARMAASGVTAELAAYLSPEVRAGGAPGPADDVYSLGAILWKLLLGEAPPLDPGADLGAGLATARMIDGEALRADLAELLLSSLTTPPARTPHAGAWHNHLTEWMSRNQVTTTHFDLAFFVHELFRRRILSEQEEIEKEKKIDLAPKPAPPAPPAPAPGEPQASDTFLRSDLSGMVQRPVLSAQEPDAGASETGVIPPPSRRSKAPLVAGLATVILAAAVAGYLALRGDVPAPPPAQEPPAPPPPAPAAAPPSSELAVAQLELERLVEEQARNMGDQLAREYEEQIRSLREQLQAAQTAEEDAMREVLAGQAAPPAPSSPAGAAPPAPISDPAGETDPTTGEDPVAQSSARTAGSATAIPPAESLPAATPPGETTPRETRPGETRPGETRPGETTPGETRPAKASPAVTPPAEPRPEESPPAELQVAEASPPETPASLPPRQAPSPNPPPAGASPDAPSVAVPVVTPPRRLRMQEPRYPLRARQHRKEATVLVKVLVDARGRVVDARQVIEKPDTYGFHQEAIRAARTAEFEPATSDGVATQMWTTVVISFRVKR